MTLALTALATLGLAGCGDKAERNPVPALLVDHALVPSYEQIRFWGDKDTFAFDEAMKQQYTELKAAAQSGKLPNADKVANILAISGGGDEGAFAAGYLKGWSDSGTRQSFDTVTGVSTGALAAPFAFLGPLYDDEVRRIYTETGADQLYDARWDFGVFGDALKDTGPLRSTIDRFVDEKFLDEIAAQDRLGRRLLVSTTNLDIERPVIWDLSAIAASGRPDRCKLFVDLLITTSAVPGIFPPVKINVRTQDGRMHDELHADGSVAMQMFFLPPDLKKRPCSERLGSGRFSSAGSIPRRLSGELAVSKDKLDQVALKDLSIFARHGLFDAEAELGQRFFIDVCIGADLSYAEREDETEGTVNWADMVQIVTEAFTQRRYKLIEAAAAAIANALLKHFPIAQTVRVEVRKPSAPIEAIFAYSAVVVERSRRTP